MVCKLSMSDPLLTRQSYELTSFLNPFGSRSNGYVDSGLYWYSLRVVPSLTCRVTVPPQTEFATKVSPPATTQGPGSSVPVPYGFDSADCCADGGCCYPGFTCTPHGYSFCCPVNTTLCNFGIGSCCSADEVCLQDDLGNGTCWHPDVGRDLDLNGTMPLPMCHS